MEERRQELDDRLDRALAVADEDARVHIKQAQQRMTRLRTEEGCGGESGR